MNNNYTSILICYEADEADGPVLEAGGISIYVNGEKKGADTLPNELQAKFNANRMWSLANNLCRVAGGMNVNNLKRAYIGLPEVGWNPAEIMFLKEMNFISNRIDEEKNIEKFYESAKDLLKIWPNNISHVLLVLDFGEGNKLFDDHDFLAMTHFSGTNIEAAVFNVEINDFVVQGYDKGEYDTGYYSNEGDESYLSDSNSFIVNLQNRKFVDGLIKNIG